MRAYLAMQAMESGKSLGGSYLGRTGLVPFGQGNMLMGGDHGAQGKVCKCTVMACSLTTKADLTSNSSSYLPLAQHWKVDACRTKHHGPHRVLFSRQVHHDLLHQQ